MVICIDEISDIPIYKQIRNQIVLGISDGRLKTGRLYFYRPEKWRQSDD